MEGNVANTAFDNTDPMSTMIAALCFSVSKASLSLLLPIIVAANSPHNIISFRTIAGFIFMNNNSSSIVDVLAYPLYVAATGLSLNSCEGLVA
jgi:uncharacterized membrane protein